MRYNVAKISELLPFLTESGTYAKKSLSQNFLIDGNILRKIIKTAAVEKNELVVEIGPGPGALTEALLQAGAHVIAIEKDALFSKALERLQSQYENKLTIYCHDITTFDISSVVDPLLQEKEKAKVIANLPYQMTSLILSQFLPLNRLFSSLTFMVQHEVGQRIVAKTCSHDYSSLTLFTRFYSEPFYAFKVPSSCFYPAPKIDSAVIHFALHHTLPDVDPAGFFAFVRQAFQHRRKMLRASLRARYAAEDITYALQTCNLLLSSRPQELSLPQFIQLFTALKN